MEKACDNCKYRDLTYYEEPCKSCSYYELNNWKPKEEVGMEKDCANCKYREVIVNEFPCGDCIEHWELTDKKCSKWTPKEEEEKVVIKRDCSTCEYKNFDLDNPTCKYHEYWKLTNKKCSKWVPKKDTTHRTSNTHTPPNIGNLSKMGQKETKAHKTKEKKDEELYTVTLSYEKEKEKVGMEKNCSECKHRDTKIDFYPCGACYNGNGEDPDISFYEQKGVLNIPVYDKIALVKEILEERKDSINKRLIEIRKESHELEDLLSSIDCMLPYLIESE